MLDQRLIFYESSCPSCNGRISAERLGRGLPCEQCSEEEMNLCGSSSLKGLLRKKCWVIEQEKKLKDFETALGKQFDAYFKFLVRRFLLGETFGFRYDEKFLKYSGVEGFDVNELWMVLAYYWLRHSLGSRVVIVFSSDAEMERFERNVRSLESQIGRLLENYSLQQKKKHGFFLLTIGESHERENEISSRDLVLVPSFSSIANNYVLMDKFLSFWGLTQEDKQLFKNLYRQNARAEARLSELKKIFPAQAVFGIEADFHSNWQVKILETVFDVVFLNKKDECSSGFWIKYRAEAERIVEAVEQSGPGGLIFCSTQERFCKFNEMKSALEEKGLFLRLDKEWVRSVNDSRSIYCTTDLEFVKKNGRLFKYVLMCGLPEKKYILQEKSVQDVYVFLLMAMSLLLRRTKNFLHERFLVWQDLEYVRQFIGKKYDSLLPQVKNKLKQIKENLSGLLEHLEAEGSGINGLFQIFQHDGIWQARVYSYLDFYNLGVSVGKRIDVFCKQQYYNLLIKVLSSLTGCLIDGENSAGIRLAVEGDRFKKFLIITDSLRKAKSLGISLGLNRGFGQRKNVWEGLRFHAWITVVWLKGFNYRLRSVENSNEMYYSLQSVDMLHLLDFLRIESFKSDVVFVLSEIDKENEKLFFDLKLQLYPFNRSIIKLLSKKITVQDIAAELTGYMQDYQQKTSDKAFDSRRDTWTLNQGLSSFYDVDKDLVYSAMQREIQELELFRQLNGVLEKCNCLSGLKACVDILKWVRNKQLQSRKVFRVSVYLKGRLFSYDFDSYASAMEFYDNAQKFYVRVIQRQVVEQRFNAYSFWEIIKDAAEKLNFEPDRSFDILNDLYAFGLITYFLGSQKNQANSTDNGVIGLNAIPGRIFPAHLLDAAQRFFTDRFYRHVELSKEHYELYDLIYRRFQMSQLKKAQIQIAKAEVKINGIKREVEYIEKVLDETLNVIWPLDTWQLATGEYKAEIKFLSQEQNSFTVKDLLNKFEEVEISDIKQYITAYFKLKQCDFIRVDDTEIALTERGKILVDNM